MRKILSLGVLVAVFVIGIAGPAGAGPTRTAAPAPDPLDLPDIFCGFDVRAQFPKNNEYTLTYTDGSGTVTHSRTTGAFETTLTNMSNDHAATFNISGPGNLVWNEDGSTTLHASGTWLFLFAPDQLGAGSPGELVLFTGHTVLWTAANGFDQQIVSFSGTTRDVCAAIA